MIRHLHHYPSLGPWTYPANHDKHLDHFRMGADNPLHFHWGTDNAIGSQGTLLFHRVCNRGCSYNNCPLDNATQHSLCKNCLLHSPRSARSIHPSLSAWYLFSSNSFCTLHRQLEIEMLKCWLGEPRASQNLEATELFMKQTVWWVCQMFFQIYWSDYLWIVPSLRSLWGPVEIRRQFRAQYGMPNFDLFSSPKQWCSNICKAPIILVDKAIS